MSRRWPVGRRRWYASAETPTRNIATVASRNGAPTIAPIATSSEPSEPPRIATSGMRLSGIAVPTAASRLPTAPSPSDSLCPIHSTALVNVSAPTRITAKLAARRRTSPNTPRSGEEEGEGDDGVDGEQLHALEPVRLALVGDDLGDQDGDQNGAELEPVEDQRHRLGPEHEGREHEDGRHEEGDLGARA